jgi:hypothetical protein
MYGMSLPVGISASSFRWFCTRTPRINWVLPALLATYGTWSVNLRYDVVSNLALKAEISRPQGANGSYVAGGNPASDARVFVFSLGADFVF